MRERRKRSFLGRIRKSYVVFSALTTTVALVITFGYTIPRYASESISLSIANCTQISRTIEYNLKEISILSRMMHTRRLGDRYATYYLEHELPENAFERARIEQSIRDVFAEFSTFRADLAGVTLYGKNGLLVDHYSRTSPSAEDMRGYLEFFLADSHHRPLVLRGEYPAAGAGREGGFTVIQPLWNASLSGVVAVMAIDFSLDVIRELADRSDLGLGEELLLATLDGDVVYSTRRPYLNATLEGGLLDSIRSLDATTARIRYGGGSYYIVRLPAEHTGLYIVTLLPVRSIYEKSAHILLLLLVTVCCVTAFSIFTASRLSKRLSRPIRLMMGGIARIGEGDFGTRFEPCDDEEFDFLATGLNNMTLTIRDLINQKYVLLLTKKDAELKALIAQINPHFINNTLELISGIAYEHHVPVVCEMVTALGQMLRYAIKTGEVVTLREEFLHVDSYLLIYNYRFDKNITVVNRVEEKYMESGVLKLILQPLVENSVKYAPDAGSLAIEVRAEELGRDLLITVADNAGGIAPDRLAEIRGRLESSVESPLETGRRLSLGLNNVHRRIAFFYGRHYGLDIESRLGAGTTVTIRLPAERTLADV